jgi:hypothetical protein
MDDDPRRSRHRIPGPRACLVPILFLALLPCLSPAARAGDLASCKGSSNVAGYKVYLDDLSITPASADLPQQMDALRFRLESELQGLKQELGTQIKVVWCEGRKPSGESAFSPDLLDVLRVKRVVLEVWGSVSDREALVSFLIIPVPPGERGEHGFHQVPYTLGKTSNPLDLFKERSDLPALGFLSMALYDLTLKNGPGAYSLLTKAELWLKKDPKPAAGLVDYIHQLQKEARRMACQSQSSNLACRAPQP